MTILCKCKVGKKEFCFAILDLQQIIDIVFDLFSLQFLSSALESFEINLLLFKTALYAYTFEKALNPIQLLP